MGETDSPRVSGASTGAGHAPLPARRHPTRELFADQEKEAFNGMLGALHTIGVAINENIEIKPP